MQRTRDDQFEATEVYVVAEDPLLRAGLAALAERSGLEVLASLHPNERAQAQERSAVWLWELGASGTVPKESGWDRTELRVLAFASDARTANEAIEAGALGVLLRSTTDPDTLLAAVKAVRAGLLVFDGSLQPTLQKGSREGAREVLRPESEELTARELEVLQQLAAGHSNKTIAQRLGISEHTVKFHVNAILTKLGAQGRTDAVVRAARKGLVLL